MNKYVTLDKALNRAEQRPRGLAELLPKGSCQRRVQPISKHDLGHPQFSRTVYLLAYHLHRRLKIKPHEWRLFLIFLASFVECLDVDTEHLEQAAKLSCLEFNGDADGYDEPDSDAKAFEERLLAWFGSRLCRRPLQHGGGYVHQSTRPWFLTVATVLRAAFPDIVRRQPRWRSHRYATAMKRIKAAWREEKRCRKPH
jgi:hypothetical protein